MAAAFTKKKSPERKIDEDNRSENGEENNEVTEKRGRRVDMKRAITWDALMQRIVTVEKIEDFKKLKRLHLFSTDEQLQRALSKVYLKDGINHDTGSHDSVNTDIMDKLSATSHFDNYDFQTILMNKIGDVKEVFSMVINAVQQNALVLYSMSN